MRAPSSFHSNAASPSRASASSASSAGCASIGWSGRNSCTAKRARPAAPSARAALATTPRSPASITARRTSPAGNPAALATASSITPSSAPWRSSPTSRRRRKSCSRLGRPGEQLAQQAQPLSRRPLALDRHEAIERRVELAEGQAGTRRRRLGPRLTQGRMPDPDPALARQPRQQADRDLRRLRPSRAQTVREMADLSEPPARLGHPRRGLHDLVQPHGHGHAAASRSRQNGEFSEGC